jgi:hypothetical protein
VAKFYRRNGTVTLALWLTAIGGALYLAYRHYHGLVAITPSNLGKTGGDFWGYLHSAREVAAGRSPYSSAGYFGGFYVYTPLVALILAPFAHAATLHVWQSWTALSIAALVLFGGLVSLTEAPRLRSWRLPLLFGITAVTVLHFGQTGVELYYGNTDAFVLTILATAVLASEAGWAATSGVLIGLTGLIKTWPAAAGLAIFRRGYTGRYRALVGLVVTLLLGPILAAAVGGTSGIVDFIKATYTAHTQPLLSYSVWSTPFQLFAKSGIARPMLVSAPLRDVATVVLAAWVICLLVLILVWSDSSVLAFWNVVACVVLLLPVSHSNYTLFLLPILWVWIARWLEVPRIGGLVFAITALLVLWWLVSSKNWYYGLNNESALRLSVVFFANLAAVTVSVLGDHLQRIPLSSSSWRTFRRLSVPS